MLTKGHKRKQQIIDTTKDMFIDSGFQSTHIGKVCELLNIARGTVYQYFGNKREILYAILESVEENIDDVLDPDDLKDLIKNNPSQKSILNFINDRLTLCLGALISEPIVTKLIFRDIVGIDEGVVNRTKKFIDHVTKAVKLDIEEIIKKGYARKGINSDDTALVLIGGILFVANSHSNSQTSNLDKIAIEEMVNNYLKGVLK